MSYVSYMIYILYVLYILNIIYLIYYIYGYIIMSIKNKSTSTKSFCDSSPTFALQSEAGVFTK